METDDQEVLKNLLAHVFVLEAPQNSLIGLFIEDAVDPHDLIDRLREKLPRKSEPGAPFVAVLEARLAQLERMAEREVTNRQQGIG